ALAHLLDVVARDPVETPSGDAALQLRGGPSPGPEPATTAPSQDRDPEPHRPPRLGAGPAGPGCAAAGGPGLRERRVHPGCRSALVRDAVRARLARRVDAGDQRLSGVRRGRA